MIIAFTRSNLILSRFIRWLSGDPVSHVVIIFDNKIIFHSNLKGVHLEWLENFKEVSEIVYEIKYDLTLKEEEQIYQNIMKSHRKGGYDFLALSYFIYRGLLYKFFGIALPKNNYLDSINNKQCTELIKCTEPIIWNNDKDLAMTRPYEIYQILTLTNISTNENELEN